MGQTRDLRATAATYETRTETFEGREHLVVPVVALVEGVVFAMNAKQPELVTAEEFGRAPGGWNGRPIFFNHPVNQSGKPVSGNAPELLETQRIGTVFNASLKKNKLTMEAWIDVERAAALAPDLLERALAKEPIEISVGVFTDTDDKSGVFGTKKYAGVWHDIVPDHLALLPEDVPGACSLSMGCGVRAAQKGEHVKERSGILGAALSRVLAAFRSAQPADEMSSNDLTSKLYKALREIESNVSYVVSFLPVTDPNRVIYECYEPGFARPDGGYTDGKYTTYERGFSLDSNGTVVLNGDRVEVQPVMYYEPVLLNESEEEMRDAAGKRNSARDLKAIQQMHDHAVYLGAYCEPKIAQKNAAPGAPCSEHGNSPEPTAAASAHQKETENMDKNALVKFLETATECQLKALSAVAEGQGVVKTQAEIDAQVKAAADKAAADKETELKASQAAPKPVTFADMLATADVETRDSINEGLRVGREKKAATIKALKDTGRCDHSDDELGKMTQADLDRLVKLAGSNVRAAIDYSGQAPKDTSVRAEEVPAAPDLAASIKAARAAK